MTTIYNSYLPDTHLATYVVIHSAKQIKDKIELDKLKTKNNRNLLNLGAQVTKVFS